MAKMFALRTIIRRNKDGVQETLAPKTVFDVKPAEAKQLADLGSARPARDDEITVADEAQARADGTFFTADAPLSAPVEAVAETNLGSGAEGDPQNVPKGKSK